MFKIVFIFKIIYRKSNEPPKEGEGDAPKPTTQKVYYLSCLNCRWTSREVGIPDQTVGKFEIVSEIVLNEINFI